MIADAHTFGQDCPRCPGRRGRPGRCDHARYSQRYRRFLRRHAPEMAYDIGDRAAASASQERLHREYATLPPRHDCSCSGGCPQEVAGWVACPECRRLRRAQVRQDVAVEIGHTRALHAPTPSVELLDLLAGYA